MPFVPFKDRYLLQSPTRLTWYARWPIPCCGYTDLLPSHVAPESTGQHLQQKRATGEHARPGSAGSSARRICRSTESPQRIMDSGRTQPSGVSTLGPQFPGPSRPQTRGTSGCNLTLILGGCGSFPRSSWHRDLAGVHTFTDSRAMYISGHPSLVSTQRSGVTFGPFANHAPSSHQTMRSNRGTAEPEPSLTHDPSRPVS